MKGEKAMIAGIKKLTQTSARFSLAATGLTVLFIAYAIEPSDKKRQETLKNYLSGCLPFIKG